MQSSPVATKTKVSHQVRDDFKVSCFYLAECICGKVMWATSKAELNTKWKEHVQ